MGFHLISLSNLYRANFLQAYAVIAYGLYFLRSAAPEPCFLTFSELKLGEETNTGTDEFIELRASSSCPLPLDLTPYTLVLWSSTKSLPAPFVMEISNFSVPVCAAMHKNLLVLGNPEMAKKIEMTDATFCSFNDFGSTWQPSQPGHYWIDKGNSKINALALYKDLPTNKLHLSVKISAETAYRDYLVDVLFYKKSGSESVLKSFLLPTYTIGSPNAPFYCLQNREGNSNSGSSFTYCCSDANLTKWPLGYKWSRATPGKTNECGTLDYAVFGVNGNILQSQPAIVEALDKCLVNEIEEYLGGSAGAVPVDTIPGTPLVTSVTPITLVIPATTVVTGTSTVTPVAVTSAAPVTLTIPLGELSNAATSLHLAQFQPLFLALWPMTILTYF